MATVDELQRSTAKDRRELIIRTLSREFDVSEPTSGVSRFGQLLNGPTRPMIFSGDIDGLVSSMMLATVTDWRAVAYVYKSQAVHVHPSIAGGQLDLGSLFGVDVSGAYFPSVSNHVALWGGRATGGSPVARAAARAHDEVIAARAQGMLLANPSMWAGVQGSYGDDASRANGGMYRYPLGTAQFLLALLEALGRPPKLFDRDYLPWLVAHCDGGLTTIRQYPYNVPLWWSSLAAVVGPASLSEQLYQLAMNQRPTQFVETVDRLRSEGVGDPFHVSRQLDDNWNLIGRLAISPVSRWIQSISGWSDPFLGGVDGLVDWVEYAPVSAGSLAISGLPSGDSLSGRLEIFKSGLRSSLSALHTNFNMFDQKYRLSWVMPWASALAPDLPPLPDDLLPNEGQGLGLP